MTEERDRSRLLKSQHAAAIESVVARFEDEWEEGKSPAIEAYLPVDAPERHELLVELVHADLEYRWKSGEQVAVSAYLQRYPELQEDADAIAELHEAEAALRKRCAEPAATALHLEEITAGRDEKGAKRDPDGASFEPPDSDSSENPRLGKFELVRQVGQGAFGTVYMARDTNLDRIVAVKVPRHGRFGSKEEEERFIREARSAAQLQHPGIIPVFEVGRSGSFPYIVSEFVEGVTLDEAIYARPFSPRLAARVVALLADALEHAHQHGVVHRDLKPSNVMLQGYSLDDDSDDPSISRSALTTEGLDSTMGSTVFRADAGPIPRLMDFGLARRVEVSTSTTVEGVILGTPAYMSPEQARGEAYRVDGRSDIYSLGVVLYQMLTLELPFRGKLRMLLDQVLHEDPRPPRRLNDRIPRDLETITLKCLAKDPAARYQTAGELVAELERFLSGMPIQARPVSRIERAWRWCRRKPAVAASLAAAVAFLMAALVASTVGYINVSKALIQTEEARSESDESLRHARQAVDDFFTEVSENDLLNQPGMHPLRRKLLLRAREYYEKLLEQRQGESALRSELADAHFRIGLITEEIDSPKEAIKSYERARKIQDALLAKDASDVDCLESLGNTLNAIGCCLQKAGDFKGAMEAYSRALRIRRRLVEKDPDAPELRRKLANIHMNIGLLSKATVLAEMERLRRDYYERDERLGREIKETADSSLKERIKVEKDRVKEEFNEEIAPLQQRILDTARPSILEAQAIREEIIAGGDETTAVRHDLAMGKYELAKLAQSYGDFEQTEQLAKSMIADFKRLTEEQSQSMDIRLKYATCYSFLADAQCARIEASLMGEESDDECWNTGLNRAMKYYGEARDRLQVLVSENPTVTQFKITLAGVEVSRGMAANRLREHALGLDAFMNAETLLSSVIKAGDGGPTERGDLITTLLCIAESHKRAKRPTETIATLNRLQSHVLDFRRKSPGDADYARLLAAIRHEIQETQGSRVLKEALQEEDSGRKQ